MLEGAADSWEGALADVVARDSAADLRVLRRLGVALHHEPAVTPGPRLTGVLLGAIDARIALGKDDLAITRASRFDAALVHSVGLEAPVQPALSEVLYGLLDGGMRVQLRDVDLDVLLTFMRGARVRGEKTSVLVARAGPERIAALLQERPRSLALRLCALAAEAGDREEPKHSKRLVDLADALFPDAVVDLSLPYLVEAHVQHMRARLAQLVKVQRAGGSAEEVEERAQALIDAAKAATKDTDWAKPDVLREALNRGAEGAALLSVEESLVWRVEGVATFERRVERARAPVGTLVGIPLGLQEELRNLARILHTSANWLDDVAERRADRAALRERAAAWWREVLEVCVQLDDHAGVELATAIRASYQARRPD